LKHLYWTRLEIRNTKSFNSSRPIDFAAYRAKFSLFVDYAGVRWLPWLPLRQKTCLLST